MFTDDAEVQLLASVTVSEYAPSAATETTAAVSPLLHA
jgi:hypothetical protein